MEASWLTSPKKFRTKPSTSKFMATVSQDYKGDYIDRLQACWYFITRKYYANVIKQFRIAIKERQREKLAAGVFLLHDNASLHKSRVARAAIHECKFELLNHPPYSRDLVLSYYCLSQNSKYYLRWARFQDNDDLKVATEAWFRDQTDEYLFQRHTRLKRKVGQMHWSKGGYIERKMLA